MSSSSPTARSRLRAALAAVAFLPVFAPSPTPPAALPVVAALSGGGETALVVDLGASAPAGNQSVTVTRGGVPEKAEVEPVMSAGLNVALVVDTSADGAKALPAWLSAAARFTLEAPGSTQSVVISAGEPAKTVVPPQQGALGVVRALDGVTASGDRDTVAALTLATSQFPDAKPGRRLVVLYTTAPGADRQEAESLGARLRATGTILVVVGTSDANRFWTDTAAATGGFYAPAGDPVVVPALDQVQTTLRGRYLVRFPTPPELPADVAVRVDTADRTLTGTAVVPDATVGGGNRWTTIFWAAGIVVAVAAAVVLVIVGRRGRSTRPQSAPPPIAVGRASVPRRDPNL